MYSFYSCRSWKRKNTVKSSVSFYALGICSRKSCTSNVDEIEPCSQLNQHFNINYGLAKLYFFELAKRYETGRSWEGSETWFPKQIDSFGSKNLWIILVKAESYPKDHKEILKVSTHILRIEIVLNFVAMKVAIFLVHCWRLFFDVKIRIE